MKTLVYSLVLILIASFATAKTMTYNHLETVNMRDLGIPADERSTNVLIADGKTVFGATSGDRCHIFRYEPASGKFTDLAVLDGPNTILKGLVLDGDTIYAGTMLTRPQLWKEGRRRGGTFEEQDANLYQLDDSWKTGRLYRITGIRGSEPRVEDLGVPVHGEGIHTIAMDRKRGLLYGLTYPSGRFFIYNLRTNTTEIVVFGKTISPVSSHMVGTVEVMKDLTDYTIGEVEFGNKLVAKALHVNAGGMLFTSGWDGKIIKYTPSITDPRERFSAVGSIPSVPARQYWNRLDEIIEHRSRLYLGTSDGYIIRYDPKTGSLDNYGKPIRAVEVIGMTRSPLDGRIYGISGGDAEGVSRFWSLDPERGTFEVDYPAVKAFHLRPMGDIVCLDDGTIIMAETGRVANLWVLTPGNATEWEKSGQVSFTPSGDPHANIDHPEWFKGHKPLECDVFPIPSEMHGGSGYTAIQADRDGKVYVGGSYYGKFASLMQLDPSTAAWKLIFRSDELIREFGRGQSAPGKIHTKLRLGGDGKIYGATKQGYEFHFDIRPDMGESPEGKYGGQIQNHFFSYDPNTGITEDLGPVFKQEGVVGFCIDTKRGYAYGMTEPSANFLVLDLKTGRTWNAGAVPYGHSNRYMAMDPVTGKVYHKGEVTPSGTVFMTVWDPETFRLSDIEIAAEPGSGFSHSYAVTCGESNSKLYGESNGKLVEIDLKPSPDGKLHVRSLCTISVEGEPHSGRIYAIETGPDGRIYWGNTYGDHGFVPLSYFAWDPTTETKTYLGTCAIGGTWIGGTPQGICFDRNGNMGIHILYAKLNPEQYALTQRGAGFSYTDIDPRPHYLGYPHLYPGTWYSVLYVRNATKIR